MALTSFPLFPASICFFTFLYSLTQNANQWWLITFSDNSLDPNSALHMHLPFWLMNINQGWQFTFASGWKELLGMQHASKLKLSFFLLQLHWKKYVPPQRTLWLSLGNIWNVEIKHMLPKPIFIILISKRSIWHKHQVILKHHFYIYINLYYIESLKNAAALSTK